jgi:hypothetical protein
MDLLLLASMVVGVWAFFAITGNERERRIQKLQYELEQARRAAEAQAKKVDDIPVLG